MWTTEQVLGLAPDKYSFNISRNFAVSEKWITLGYNHASAWGEFAIKNKPPILTQIDLSDLDFACDCAARKSPCNHCLGLLLLLVEQPDAFVSADPPDWVASWLAVNARSRKNRRHLVSPNSAAQAENRRRRQANISAGLQELEIWLRDLVRVGMAAAQNRPKTYWTQIADRMVDARAGEVARELRRVADIPDHSADWPERLLCRIGRLYLLIRGFNQLETFPAEMQADLRAAVGWLPRADEIPPDSRLRDRWYVLGKQLEHEGKQKLKRTWLWGESSNRSALIYDIAYGKQPLDFSLVTGTILEAELCFHPSAVPLRAQIAARYRTLQPHEPFIGQTSVKAALAQYAQAVTANPWLRHFPLALASVGIERHGARWVLRDSAGYLLPLPEKFEHGWHLYALDRGGSLHLFGEWDGDCLYPLSIWKDDRLLELKILKGVK